MIGSGYPYPATPGEECPAVETQNRTPLGVVFGTEFGVVALASSRSPFDGVNATFTVSDVSEGSGTVTLTIAAMTLNAMPITFIPETLRLAGMWVTHLATGRRYRVLSNTTKTIVLAGALVSGMFAPISAEEEAEEVTPQRWPTGYLYGGNFLVQELASAIGSATQMSLVGKENTVWTAPGHVEPSSADGQYVDWILLLYGSYSNWASGQYRRVTAYDGTSKALSFESAFSPAPASGSGWGLLANPAACLFFTADPENVDGFDGSEDNTEAGITLPTTPDAGGLSSISTANDAYKGWTAIILDSAADAEGYDVGIRGYHAEVVAYDGATRRLSLYRSAQSYWSNTTDGFRADGVLPFAMILVPPGMSQPDQTGSSRFPVGQLEPRGEDGALYYHAGSSGTLSPRFSGTTMNLSIDLVAEDDGTDYGQANPIYEPPANTSGHYNDWLVAAWRTGTFVAANIPLVFASDYLASSKSLTLSEAFASALLSTGSRFALVHPSRAVLVTLTDTPVFTSDPWNLALTVDTPEAVLAGGLDYLPDDLTGWRAIIYTKNAEVSSNVVGHGGRIQSYDAETGTLNLYVGTWNTSTNYGLGAGAKLLLIGQTPEATAAYDDLLAIGQIEAWRDFPVMRPEGSLSLDKILVDHEGATGEDTLLARSELFVKAFGQGLRPKTLTLDGTTQIDESRILTTQKWLRIASERTSKLRARMHAIVRGATIMIHQVRVGGKQWPR